MTDLAPDGGGGCRGTAAAEMRQPRGAGRASLSGRGGLVCALAGGTTARRARIDDWQAVLAHAAGRKPADSGVTLVFDPFPEPMVSGEMHAGSWEAGAAVLDAAVLDEENAVQEVRGVIARERGKPAEVATVLIPDPGPGEAVVAVRACGVCHTDLHYREGGISDDFPFLLGHEAAGVVEAVGAGVTEVEPGDFVVLNWRAVCGDCRACRRGRPWYCFATHNASQPMTLADGTPLSAALGIGAFADKTLVHAGQCTKVDPSARAAAVGLLGCGVMAGIGAAVNTGGVGRGDSVAVIGCGGVGDGAVAGARLAGAAKIIAIDTDPRKLEWAKGFGATHTLDARAVDVVESVRELTGGFGADVVIDAVGRPETYKQAFYARDLAGTVVLVGVPTPEMRIELPLLDVFGRGGALKSSWYGDCLPSRDFPMLVDLYQQGRLDLDAFVTEEIPLDGVETALATMHTGNQLRSVVVL